MTTSPLPPSNKIITLAPDKSDRLSANAKPATPPELMEAMNMKYAEIAVLAEKNISFARGHIPAGAIVPSHAAASHYAFFVLAGAGQLTLHLADGEETGRIAYGPGDLILFPPNSHHGWINEGEALEWFGVDIA